MKPGDSLSIVPSVAGGAPSTVTYVNRAPGTDAGADLEVGLPDLTQEEIKRYSRHLIMPEVGMDGQRALKASSVLCIGAGGLGSPAAMYLAAAGVGRIGIVDFDVVDFSNLQRQLLHGTPDVGRSKLDSATGSPARAQSARPDRYLRDVAVVARTRSTCSRRTTSSSTAPTTSRRAISSTTRASCAASRTPTAASSASRVRRRSLPRRKARAIAACIPSRRRLASFPSCAEGGVLGVLPGIIGVIQATEAIKVMLGIGEPLDWAIPDLRRAQDAVPRAAAAEGSGMPGVRDESNRDEAD